MKIYLIAVWKKFTDHDSVYEKMCEFSFESLESFYKIIFKKNNIETNDIPEFMDTYEKYLN